MILAIDPGTTESGWVLYDHGNVVDSGVSPNNDLVCSVRGTSHPFMAVPDSMAVEMIASYGMAVGKEVFETCVWIGRFVEAWQDRRIGPHLFVYRRDVKLHLCGSPRAKDANIRQALIDKLGAPGTKKIPGPTYGVKSHAWAALGVAVTASETPRA